VRSLVAGAEEAMAAQGIRAPERWAELFVPGRQEM
jgi:hypothetical protein